MVKSHNLLLVEVGKKYSFSFIRDCCISHFLYIFFTLETLSECQFAKFRRSLKNPVLLQHHFRILSPSIKSPPTTPMTFRNENSVVWWTYAPTSFSFRRNRTLRPELLLLPSLVTKSTRFSRPANRSSSIPGPAHPNGGSRDDPCS